MKRFLNIVFLLLPLMLGNMGISLSAPISSAPSGEIYAATQSSNQSTHPLDRPSLFNIYHQAEQVAGSSNIMPSPPSVVEEDQNLHYQRVFNVKKLQVWVWLRAFKKLDRTHAVLKLIFPFHFFL